MPNTRIKKEIIKIRADANEIENRNTIEKINESKLGSLKILIKLMNFSSG